MTYQLWYWYYRTKYYLRDVLPLDLKILLLLPLYIARSF